MRTAYALCKGAGLRICESCRRNAEDHPTATARPFQQWVSPTTNHRCANWLAKPAHAVTPTDKR
jgi:hypothetical protein